MVNKHGGCASNGLDCHWPQMRIARVVPNALLVLSVAAIVACHDSPVSPPPKTENPTPSEIDAKTPAAPENVLSAHVSFTIAAAPDSVRVSFTENGGSVFTTPFRAGKSGTDTIEVLGLKPGTKYTYQVDALTGGTLQSSKTSTFNTADLPADLADIKMSNISGTPSRFAEIGRAHV